MPRVLVLVEHEDGVTRKVTYEMLAKARDLGDPVAVFVGEGLEGAREGLARHGATEVYAAAGDNRLAVFEESELEALSAADVRQRFGEAHQRVYFFGGEATKPIEFVSFRLGVVAPIEALPLLAETKSAATPARPIRIFDGKAWRDAHLLRRSALAQQAISGPALIEDQTSTLYVPSGWTARCDANDNAILERR